MKLQRIALIGASGHGKVVLDAALHDGRYEIAGFVDSSKSLGGAVSGIPLLGKEEDLDRLCVEFQIAGYVVCIGDNAVRAAVVGRISAAMPKLEPVVIRHTSAIVGREASIGPGSVLLAGSIVGPSCCIGTGCIVNSKASLDHDSMMGDFASLAPGVSAGGSVRIGAFSAIGIGATVLHGISIGEHTVIGAGAVVVRDVGSNIVAYGVPARGVRMRAPGERYL